MVDLLALACQEVGLDMTEDIDVEKDESCDSSNERILQDERCQNSWPLHYKEELVNSPVSEVILENHDHGSESYNNAVVTSSGSHSVVFPSPVTNLYSQRKTNQLSRRSRSWKPYEGIQGAPCRNLPDLVPRSKKIHGVESFHLEVSPSSPSNKDPLDASNPFLHLFRDHSPGQVAFAFYVADCWFSFSNTSLLPDHHQFLTQCTRWWVTLPTPYKRGYWTKEMQYKIKMGIEIEIKGKKKEKLIKNVPKNAFLENKTVESRISPLKNMREAFMIFVKKNMANVTKEMPGATGREIKHELGRRWISLSEREKEKFIIESKHLDSVISEKNLQEQDLITFQTPIKYEEKYDPKDLMIPSTWKQEVNELMTCDENMVKEVKVSQNETPKPTVEITVEEIEKFAINANYYVAED